MDFERMSRRAEEIFGEIPPEFLADVSGVDVHRRTLPHPHLDGIFTLGECGPDEAAALLDPETPRSWIHLYHGSFAAVARRDPDFDWEAELRETILHELRHHIEDRAGLPDLRREDAAEEALFTFLSGADLPRGWYRGGEELEPAVFRVADDLFVEIALRRGDLPVVAGRALAFDVLGEPFAGDLPEDVEDGEVLTWPGQGLAHSGGRRGSLHLVVVLR